MIVSPYRGKVVKGLVGSSKESLVVTASFQNTQIFRESRLAHGIPRNYIQLADPHNWYASTLTKVSPIRHLAQFSRFDKVGAQFLQKVVHCQVHMVLHVLDPTHGVQTVDGANKGRMPFFVLGGKQIRQAHSADNDVVRIVHVTLAMASGLDKSMPYWEDKSTLSQGLFVLYT